MSQSSSASYASPKALLDQLADELKPAIAAIFPNELTDAVIAAAARKAAWAHLVAASFDEPARRTFLWALTLRTHASQKGVLHQIIKEAEAAGLDGMALHVLADEDEVFFLMIETTLGIPQMCDDLRAILLAHDWTIKSFLEYV